MKIFHAVRSNIIKRNNVSNAQHPKFAFIDCMMEYGLCSAHVAVARYFMGFILRARIDVERFLTGIFEEATPHEVGHADERLPWPENKRLCTSRTSGK